ncbi:transposase [Ktedonobacter sp. SOSP1-52]|uniref:transposase n=1 Tax=Ktedonobacter sp. SOSP1-52 TaxID=2778366 RepID=UPI00191507AC|nr:transposase [Ktedonobacter sp. SOSP1-52]
MIPAHPPHPKEGRPAADDQEMFATVVYILRAGIPWNACSREMGASSTACDRFLPWEHGHFIRKV